MLTSLALIFLVGLAMASICQKVRLPRIIGMLLTGIVLGPYVLDLLDPSILGISGELRRMALIIILIKAGLSLDIADLKRVGRPALMMSCVPASFEVFAYWLLAPMILGINRQEAALLGSVMSAVSPAVVVPRMVYLIENKYGTKKSIPQMILAGASLDDVFVIVLFSTFLGIAAGGTADLTAFLNIPISIVLGILLGGVTGAALAAFFEWRHKCGSYIRNSMKVIIMLGVAFILMAAEGWLEDYVAVSGLLAVTSMACALKMRSIKEVASRLSQKFGKLWLAAEVTLFVLVGAAVDIRYTLEAGPGALIMIFCGLCIRSVGVWLCMIGTDLNIKERIFCIIAYLPKATVQAAIGSVPLTMGLPCGNLVLSVAVLGILTTAPLGAFGMEMTHRSFLEHNADV
ncbi:MAG: cation:proton antiporter [Eubacteriales bacterium]|nr:cation:proton antiporter [Eubacteriales bacterium]